MKIGQNPEIANAVSQAATAAKQAKAPAAAAETAAKTAAPAAVVAAGVPVTFSNAARGLDANSRASTDFDANKVKAVRAAIEKGTFSVDADAIADKLLSNAQEIISHNSNSH